MRLATRELLLTIRRFDAMHARALPPERLVQWRRWQVAMIHGNKRRLGRDYRDHRLVYMRGLLGEPQG